MELTTGERMVDLIEEGFDLAVRPVPPPDSSLIVRRLMRWRSVLCCSPDYLAAHPTPESPNDLTRHNCLRYAFYPFGDEWRFESPGGEPVSVHVAGNFVTNNATALRRLTLDGHGLFLAPPFVVADDLREGRLVGLLQNYRPVEFSINAIYPHRHHVSTKVRTFIDLLALRFAEMLR